MERGAGAEAIGAEAARARAQAAEMTTRVKELSALLSNIAPNDLNKWLLKKGIAQATDWTPAIENGFYLNPLEIFLLFNY